jgi:hypothetical protein
MKIEPMAIAFAAALLARSSALRADQPANLDVSGIEAAAKNVFGVPAVGRPTTETRENLVALRMGPFTVTRRTDSRTWFVRNEDYGPLAEDGAFDGSEDLLRKTAAKILAGLQIDAHEVARERVLHMVQGAGEFDETTGEAKAGLWEGKQTVLIAERQVDGVPVFSSRLYLALTASGGIGRLNLHWPQIPASVMAEARRYQEVVRAGFKPAPSTEAVASVTAGIIHSSPRSRQLDILPAIRVQYVGGKEGMPRIVYLDADGKTVRARHDPHPAPPREHKPVPASGTP